METKKLRRRYLGNVLMLTLVLAAFCLASGVGVATAFAQGEQAAGQMAAAAEGPVVIRWDLSMAIAVAIAVPCLAAGYAVGRVGAAALGAASEKPELLTRSLLFVALAEGIAIYGLLVAVLLYLKL
ncbi:MAG: ATP synthase subunit C [Planctomycetota bacterium]|jgi:V/A-type H+-transporting ATPase subunit K